MVARSRSIYTDDSLPVRRFREQAAVHRLTPEQTQYALDQIKRAERQGGHLSRATSETALTTLRLAHQLSTVVSVRSTTNEPASVKDRFGSAVAGVLEVDRNGETSSTMHNVVLVGNLHMHTRTDENGNVMDVSHLMNSHEGVEFYSRQRVLPPQYEALPDKGDLTGHKRLPLPTQGGESIIMTGEVSGPDPKLIVAKLSFPDYVYTDRTGASAVSSVTWKVVPFVMPDGGTEGYRMVRFGYPDTQDGSGDTLAKLEIITVYPLSFFDRDRPLTTFRYTSLPRSNAASRLVMREGNVLSAPLPSAAAMTDIMDFFQGLTEDQARLYLNAVDIEGLGVIPGGSLETVRGASGGVRLRVLFNASRPDRMIRGRTYSSGLSWNQLAAATGEYAYSSRVNSDVIPFKSSFKDALAELATIFIEGVLGRIVRADELHDACVEVFPLFTVGQGSAVFTKHVNGAFTYTAVLSKVVSIALAFENYVHRSITSLKRRPRISETLAVIPQVVSGISTVNADEINIMRSQFRFDGMSKGNVLSQLRRNAVEFPIVEQRPGAFLPALRIEVLENLMKADDSGLNIPSADCYHSLVALEFFILVSTWKPGMSLRDFLDAGETNEFNPMRTLFAAACTVHPVRLVTTENKLLGCVIRYVDYDAVLIYGTNSYTQAIRDVTYVYSDMQNISAAFSRAMGVEEVDMSDADGTTSGFSAECASFLGHVGSFRTEGCVLAGHSLGGAVAALIGLTISAYATSQHDAPEHRVLTFGAPSAYGRGSKGPKNTALSNRLTTELKQHKVFINKGDIVPMLGDTATTIIQAADYMMTLQGVGILINAVNAMTAKASIFRPFFVQQRWMLSDTFQLIAEGKAVSVTNRSVESHYSTSYYHDFYEAAGEFLNNKNRVGGVPYALGLLWSDRLRIPGTYDDGQLTASKMEFTVTGGKLESRIIKTRNAVWEVSDVEQVQASLKVLERAIALFIGDALREGSMRHLYNRCMEVGMIFVSRLSPTGDLMYTQASDGGMGIKVLTRSVTDMRASQFSGPRSAARARATKLYFDVDLLRHIPSHAHRSA